MESCLETLEEIRQEMGISIIAFVLMPNHFHGLIRVRQKADLSIFMRKWKSLSARRILDWAAGRNRIWLRQFRRSAVENRCTKRQDHQVWIPRFDYLPIEDDKQLYAGLNYIHFNPVRHLLVSRPDKYPYSSINDYMGSKNGFMGINPISWYPRSEQALTREEDVAFFDLISQTERNIGREGAGS